MKIITKRQPWAHLIVNGSKNAENRTWPTSYRGPALIHASLNINRKACLANRIDPATLPRGGVVGIAEITDCVEQHSSRWFGGPYGFVLRKRRAEGSARSSGRSNRTTEAHKSARASRLTEKYRATTLLLRARYLEAM
jgi:hypothetical protein